LGFALIVALEYRRVLGGVIIGILVVTIISIVTGHQKFQGVFDVPPSIAPVFLQMDLAGALGVGLVTVVFTFLFIDLFDNTGTLIALAHRGGFMRPDGTVPRLNRALMADSAAAMARRGGRHLDHDQLHRERVGHQRGRPHRAHRAHRRGAVPAGAVRGAARGLHSALRNGAGAALRRLPDDARSGRGRLGRHHRGGAGGDHGDRDAVHLLDRRRHRLRFHRLHRHQAGRRKIRDIHPAVAILAVLFVIKYVFIAEQRKNRRPNADISLTFGRATP
jgi:hypothetical protein